MSAVISIINQKGGVGKSTTAQALAAGLSLKGKSTLLIDLDPQGNTTYTRSTRGTRSTLYDALTKKSDISGAIEKSDSGDMIASSSDLSRLDIELSSTGKEYRLKEVLEPIKGQYDFIVIDTPPALGIITVNALTASDFAVIPAIAEIYSIQGVGQLYSTIKAVRDYCNPNLKIQGILLTRHNERTILNRDMREIIEDTASQLGTSIYNTFIREGIAIRESQAKKQDIFSYAPKSNPALDYLDFVDEVLERSNLYE
ncbi:sporulation initiation inhibitor protein Soj [Andreesenia angusta]|uniref:Sporulation initiation inhibitor protein Soj n=1 Tax=Andreesenia angusta TaxID=39480 RepID=A0A1S1V3Q6_9FIRM|nr:AAA family ATPase [Andreesenia angusta]OHW61242.1 sporulation initiation inhibitor protein Soj [Andreesenia angusta]